MKSETNWKTVPLSEVCEFLDFRRRPVNETERRERIKGKSQAELYPYYGANGLVGWIDAYLFDEPLILLAEDGGFFGSKDKPIAYAVTEKCWVNNHAHVLRPKPGYDFDFCLHSLAIRPDVGDMVTGNTRPKLNQEVASRIPMRVTSYPEQRRIAGLLTAQLAAVGKARNAAAERVEVAGRLVDALLDHHFTDEVEGDPVTVGDIAEITASLVDPKLERYKHMQHVNGETIQANSGRLLPTRTAAEEKLISGKYMFDAGDVLYSKLRPYLRKVAIADFDGLCSADMYPMKPKHGLVESEYLKYLLLSRSFTDYAVEQSARARMPKLNREELFAYETKLPPLKRQRDVVRAIKAEWKSIETMRDAMDKELAMIEALPGKLLGAVFG